MTCICESCSARGTEKCPKRELKERADYFRELARRAENGRKMVQSESSNGKETA